MLLFHINEINTKLRCCDFRFSKDRDTHTHPYPLRVSWPRRRTRCTSLWSTALVKRLAWYAPFPVSPSATRTNTRATHPSSTWASFPDPIGWSDYSSNRAVWLFFHSMDPGWAEGSRPGPRPSALQSRGWIEGEEMRAKKHTKHKSSCKTSTMWFPAYLSNTRQHNTSPSKEPKYPLIWTALSRFSFVLLNFPPFSIYPSFWAIYYYFSCLSITFSLVS